MTEKMAYSIDWIIPKLRNPSRLWGIASTITVAAVGLFSKILIRKNDQSEIRCISNGSTFSGWLNYTKVHNRDIISNLLSYRDKSVPLITISNHHSCFDDPGIWGKF